MPARVKDMSMPLPKAAFLAAISVVAISEAPPFWMAGYDVVEIAAYGGLILSAPTLIATALNRMAAFMDGVEARIPSNFKKAAQFAKSIKQFGSDLVRFKHAPYWGTLKGKPIFADFQSNALILGPAGTSKDVSHAGPNIMAIRESKVILDMKADMMMIYARALRARGETVHCLNYGGINEDRIIDPASYNPLHLIARDFTHGSINDVSADVTEMVSQIYPEPKSEGEGGNKYFRNGSRKLIAFAILILICVEGENATLADVLALLEDRDKLRFYAQWVAGELEQDDATL